MDRESTRSLKRTKTNPYCQVSIGFLEAAITMANRSQAQAGTLSMHTNFFSTVLNLPRKQSPIFQTTTTSLSISTLVGSS